MALPAVTGARIAPAGGCGLTVTEPARALPALFDVVSACGAALAHLETRHATLEEVFVTLTGRHLRDS